MHHSSIFYSCVVEGEGEGRGRDGGEAFVTLFDGSRDFAEGVDGDVVVAEVDSVEERELKMGIVRMRKKLN